MSIDSVAPKQLDFQLAVTSETITSMSGLAVFYETALAAGVVSHISEFFSTPGSNHGLRPEEYVMPLALMFCGGGRTMEDIRKIEKDQGLRRLLGFRRIPGADAIAKWLKAPWQVWSMRRLNEHLCRVVLNRSETQEFTLDIDATFIKTEKKTAKMNYQGDTAFEPLLGYLAEPGLCVACDFRNGNVPPGEGIEPMLRRVHRLVSGQGKKLRYLRSDSAGYQADIINTCRDLKVTFTITADQDAAVKAEIDRIEPSSWQPLHREDGEKTDREYAVTVHCMEKTKASFRLIVQRWANHPQLEMRYADNDADADTKANPYGYYCIATSDDEREPKEIIWFHNQRGNAENYHKELKTGFGLDYVPCQLIRADAVYFEIGILAHNLTVALKRVVLGGDWTTKTIATLRWELVTIAGKVVWHGRKLLLRVAADHYELLKHIRDRLRLIFSLIPT